MSASPSPEVGPADEIPLSIEPVLGWRVWRLTREDGQLRLQAVAHLGTWMPQEATVATCSLTSHRAPLESCTCGYYAASSIENLATSGVFVRGVGVIGAIAMWGTVIEHARGARSEYAYPARLRLVCGPCLQQGSFVDPTSVVDDTWLIPLCDRHWRSIGHGHSSASAVQEELLATYGVELLPRPQLSRIRNPEKPGITALSILRWVVLAIVHVLQFVIGAFIALWLIGVALAVVGIVLGAVVGAVSGSASPSPSAMASSPPSSLVHADRTVEHHRRPPSVPVVPRFAAPCGSGHGEWVELVPCLTPGTDLLGISQRSVPKGERHDCPGKVDAYSQGPHWWICWIALPGAWIEHDAVSPNPYTAPKAVGGVV